MNPQKRKNSPYSKRHISRLKNLKRIALREEINTRYEQYLDLTADFHDIMMKVIHSKKLPLLCRT